MSESLTPEDRLATLALVELTQVGPARFRWLCHDRSPAEALDALARGRLPQADAPPRVSERLVDRWTDEARRARPEDLMEAYHRAGISILFADDAAWPFGPDPEPPAVVFYRGNLAGLANPDRVCVIGTRNCSSIGRTVARSLGHDLIRAGVAVVSGLALGIDGEAHAGALAAVRVGERAGPPGGSHVAVPIGVVGSGLDVVYPKRHRDLWEEVAVGGLLLSEAPLGAEPLRWRFPARNRLLASLSRLVVVVESHERGGSLLTVESAVERNVDVAAVPGSVLNRSCRGTNALLMEGASLVRGAEDVLGLLGLDSSAALAPREGGSAESPEALMLLPTTEAAVLDQVLAGGTHLDRLLGSLGYPPAEVMAAVQALVTRGLVAVDGSTIVATPDTVSGAR